MTRADAERDGSARYYVYLLASPEGEKGLAGIQLGIDYNDQEKTGQGIKVESWRACSDLEFRDDPWPAPGSGNTLTWDYVGNCQEDPIIVAGYFYVTAYSAGMMKIANFPYTGVVKTANCSIAEAIPQQPVGLDRVGWVSVGGGAIGTDSDGCNPLLDPCVYDTTTPVSSAT